MQRSEFVQSMQRVLTFFAKPKSKDEVEDQQRYLDTVYESVSWINGYQFDQVTKQVVLELNPMKKPVPPHFISVYHRLAEQQGWGKSNSSGPRLMSKEEHLQWIEQKIEQLTPNGAKFALGMIQRSNVRGFTDEELLALADKASKADADEIIGTTNQSAFADAIDKSFAAAKESAGITNAQSASVSDDGDMPPF